MAPSGALSNAATSEFSRLLEYKAEREGMNELSKPIEFSPHTLEKMHDRGASEGEVESDTSCATKGGHMMCYPQQYILGFDHLALKCIIEHQKMGG
jgi:hypothetical protein